MNIHVINDCRDQNARLRQEARLGAYFPGVNIIFAGVRTDIEAGFLLVDLLDALDGNPGVILVNVAPRNGAAKKHINGTPFGKIQIGNTIIFASVDGATLSALSKVADGVLNIYNIPDVVPHLTDDVQLQQHIVRTQFRSLEFLPRVAKAVVRDRKLVPAQAVNLKAHCGENHVGAVAFVDCFGNLKTTCLPEEIGFEPDKSVEILIGGHKHLITCFERLKDIPDWTLGLTVGSSGLGQHRFLEIMLQGGNARKQLGVKVGATIHLAK